MSGLMRLYSSLIISTPPQGQHHPHPHGVQHAWQWLARVMNNEPRPDITATLLVDMLSVAGNSLMATYGVQMRKALQALCSDYLPKIKSVNGAGGPVARLEELLEKVEEKQSGHASRPQEVQLEGVLFSSQPRKVREHCGLARAQSFEDLAPEIRDATVRRKLRRVYRHVGK